MASAATNVGSSRFAAGVPVLDLDRLVDFPNDPVSGTARRGLNIVGFPSVLKTSPKLARSRRFGLGIAQVLLLTRGRASHRVFVFHPRLRRARRRERCEELKAAC